MNFLKRHINIRNFIILLLIMVIGLLLRIYSIEKLGYFQPDESIYVSGAQYIKSVLLKSYHIGKTFIKNGFSLSAVTTELKKPLNLRGDFYMGLKHFHCFSFSLGFLIYESIYTAHLVNIIFSVMTIFLLYFIGKDILNNSFVGLAAAVSLSIMGYHIFYSRTLMAEPDAAFWLLLSFYLLLKYNQKMKYIYLVLAATFFGITIITNYRMLLNVISYSCFFFYLYRQHQKVKKTICELMIFSIFSVIPILSVEIPYIIMKFAGELDTPSYLEKFITVLLWFRLSPSSTVLQRISAYLYYFWYHNSILLNLFIIIGIVIIVYRTIKKRTISNHFFILLMPLVFFIILIILKGTPLGYIYIPQLPFLAIISGIGIYNIANYFNTKKLSFIITILSVLLVINSYYSIKKIYFYNKNEKCLKYSSAYPKVTDFIKNDLNANKVLSSARSLYIYYFGRANVRFFPKKLSKLNSLYKDEGFRYLLINWSIYSYNKNSGIDRVLKYIMSITKPIKTFKHNQPKNPIICFLPYYIAKNKIFTESLNHIYLYDLKDLFDNMSEDQYNKLKKIYSDIEKIKYIKYKKHFHY